MCYSVDLPLVGQVPGASESHPYVGIQMKLNQPIILQLMVELGGAGKNGGIAVGEISAPILDVLIRLASLACDSDDTAVLAPLIQQLHYRLLKSPQRGILRQMAALGSHIRNVSQAIQLLKQRFDQMLNMEDLAAQVNMSVPSFYKHFRQITAMSPLQYQKSLRLTEARRLVKQNTLPLSEISHAVGCESTSQFSREYSRYFGVNPSVERGGGDAAGGVF